MIKDIYYSETDVNPEISFDHQTGKLVIKGKWFTDIQTGRKLIDEIIDTIKDYFNTADKHLNIDIKLKRISTSYSKLLLEIFKFAENEHAKGKRLQINWHCNKEDEDCIETAEDFQSVLKLPLFIFHSETE